MREPIIYHLLSPPARRRHPRGRNHRLGRRMQCRTSISVRAGSAQPVDADDIHLSLLVQDEVYGQAPAAERVGEQVGLRIVRVEGPGYDPRPPAVLGEVRVEIGGEPVDIPTPPKAWRCSCSSAGSGRMTGDENSDVTTSGNLLFPHLRGPGAAAAVTGTFARAAAQVSGFASGDRGDGVTGARQRGCRGWP